MNQPKAQEEPLVKLPISLLIRLILRGEEFVTVEPIVAEALLSICQNKQYCYIQKPGDIHITGETLCGYMLWDIVRWSTSVERQLAARRRSHQLEVERRIFAANCERIGKALTALSSIPFDITVVMAASILRHEKPYAYLGVTLITKESEL